jgi:plasmid stabilization system protein ParE
MKLVYSRQALADIEAIATYYSEKASPAIASSIEQTFLAAFERLRRNPDSAPRVTQRLGVRCVTVVRYPFRIFYRANGDTIEILHIRHTARRPVGVIDPELK